MSTKATRTYLLRSKPELEDQERRGERDETRICGFPKRKSQQVPQYHRVGCAEAPVV